MERKDRKEETEESFRLVSARLQMASAIEGHAAQLYIGDSAGAGDLLSDFCEVEANFKNKKNPPEVCLYRRCTMRPEAQRYAP